MHECPNEPALIGLEVGVPSVDEMSQLVSTTDETHFSSVELPFYSVGGISSPRTMKLIGRIAGREITVMIDSGANCNFIVGDLVDRLKLSIE